MRTRPARKLGGGILLFVLLASDRSIAQTPVAPASTPEGTAKSKAKRPRTSKLLNLFGFRGRKDERRCAASGPLEARTSHGNEDDALESPSRPDRPEYAPDVRQVSSQDITGASLAGPVADGSLPPALEPPPPRATVPDFTYGGGFLMKALDGDDASPVKLRGWIQNSFTGNANGRGNGRNFGVNPNSKGRSVDGKSVLT